MDRKLGVLAVAAIVGFVLISGCIGSSDTKSSDPQDKAFEKEVHAISNEMSDDLKVISKSIRNSDFRTIARKAPEMKDRVYAHQEKIKNMNVSPSLTNAKISGDELLTEFISFLTNIELSAQGYNSGDRNTGRKYMEISMEHLKTVNIVQDKFVDDLGSLQRLTWRI